MITSRQRVIRTLNHQCVDRAPRDLHVVPAIEKGRADELAELLARYPLDIERADFKYPRGERAKGRPYEAGHHTDAWGCVWHVAEPGTPGEVCGHPLAKMADVAQYRPPLELLDASKIARVNQTCADSNRFVLAWTQTGLFSRLQFLCGSAAARTELAHAGPAIRSLLAMLHDFSCQELQMWADSDVDGVAFRDDWSQQDGLAAGPETFRGLFKPLYRDYCDILHAKDKFVFCQCDGQIDDIFGDLVETGIDAIQCQLTGMNLDRLANEFRGRITFWGDIDRQQSLRCGKPDDIRQSVCRLRAALDFGGGGLIAQCQWETKAPFGNLAALFDAWLQPLPMHQAARLME
jgi:hypothetical protein